MDFIRRVGGLIAALYCGKARCRRKMCNKSKLTILICQVLNFKHDLPLVPPDRAVGGVGLRGQPLKCPTQKAGPICTEIGLPMPVAQRKCLADASLPREPERRHARWKHHMS